MDREKVIKGLECCVCGDTSACERCGYIDDGCLDNPYIFKTAIMRDTLELLKAQEPRVMALEEVINHNNQDGCVWFEQPTYNAVAAFARQDEEYTEIISPYILGEPINHGYMSNKFYGKAWRCWTARPSVEQMEAVKWE